MFEKLYAVLGDKQRWLGAFDFAFGNVYGFLWGVGVGLWLAWKFDL